MPGESEPFKAEEKGSVQTPTVLQMESVECGAAALAIILAYYGRYVSLEELRVQCGVTRDGSNAKNLRKAAVRYGLETKAYKLGAEKLVGLRMPCIVWWNRNHYLVLEGFEADRVYLNDPATGPRYCTFEEFRDSYSMVVLQFRPGIDFAPGGAKPSLLARLVPRLRHYEGAAVFFILITFLLIVPGLAVPAFTRIFIDEILISNRESWFRPLLFGMGIAVVLMMVTTALQQRYLLRYQRCLALSSAGRFFVHVLRLPISFFAQRYGGEVGNRVAINDRIAEVVAEKLSQFIVDGLKVAIFGVLMFFYSPALALVTIVLASVNFLILRLVARIRVDANWRLMQDQGKLMATSMGGLQAMETIKGTGNEEEFFARWSGYQAKTLLTEQRLGVITHAVKVLPPLLEGLTTAAILGVGGLTVMNGGFTIGMLVAFQTVAQNFVKPLADMVQFAGHIQELQGDMTRVDDVLNHAKDRVFVQNEASIEGEKNRLSGLVEIKNLTFGYNPLGDPLIKDFSLTIRPGQRVALVGGSGSGKSTIAKLVSGLHEASSGQILFDGLSREQISRDLLKNSVAVIDQEIFLFEGSVRENLRMWNETILDSVLMSALDDANMLGRISQRPGGLSSMIEEGGRNFSGGERQRMEIARALVNDPTFLIMDEATSALDPPTEKIIEKNLLKRGCGCLIVAHRLSTIRDCDEIIVLDNGAIVERGNHHELKALGGRYARLIQESESAGQKAGRRTAKPRDGQLSAIALPGKPVTPQEELVAYFRTNGARVALENRAPLSLEDSAFVYLIVEGNVELFAIPSGEGGASGTRVRFLSVPNGELLFGIPTGSAELRMIATGVVGTTLLRLPLWEFQQLAREEAYRDEIADLVDSWVACLSQMLATRVGSPKLDIVLSAGRRAVAKNQTIGCTVQTLWVKEGGPAVLLGWVGVELGAEEPLVPLSQGSYLQPDTDTEVECETTELLLTDPRMWEGLRRLNAHVLELRMVDESIAGVGHGVAKRNIRQDRFRARIDALGALAGAMGQKVEIPVDVPEQRSDDMLFEVWQVLGQHSGFSAKRHQDVCDENEPDRNLALIAGASHVRIRRVSLAGNWWERDFNPLLAFQAPNHRPVAILPDGSQSYKLHDVGTKTEVELTKEVARTLEPFAYSIYRGLEGRAVSAKSFLKFASFGLGRDWWRVAMMTVTAGLLGALTPFFTAKIFDSVIPSSDGRMLFHYTMALVCAAFAVGAYNLVRNFAILRIEGRMDYIGQSSIWSRLLNLPMTFFRANSSGDLADRASSVDHIRKKLSAVGVEAILSVTTILFQGLAMCVINFTLALIGLAVIGILLIIVTTANVIRLRFQRAQFQHRGKLMTIVLELMKGISKLRIAAAEEHAFRLWARNFSKQEGLGFVIGRIQNFIQVVNSGFPLLASMVIFTALFILNQKAAASGGAAAISTGEFIAFNTAFTAVMMALMALSKGLLELMEVIPTFERMRPILDETPEVTEERRHPDRLRGDLELYHINFRYNTDGPLILKNVDLKIRKGEFVAIVGPSGSGKSTVLRLLLGFEQPESGYVYYDGQDLNSLDTREVRKQIGTVLQTNQLMPTTIFQNIVGADTKLTEADAMVAAKRAGFDEDIKKMPMGMHTVVSEGGTGFSGGQKQRLMIARALVNSPRIVFFDEATSALDNRTQEIVTKSLKELDATRVTIAHRLSTVVDADRIIVMRAGEVIQQGNYRDLMADKNGLFYDLARRQQMEDEGEEPESPSSGEGGAPGNPTENEETDKGGGDASRP